MSFTTMSFPTLRHLIVWMFTNECHTDNGREIQISGKSIKWMCFDIKRFAESKAVQPFVGAIQISENRIRTVLNQMVGEGIVEEQGHGTGGHARRYSWVGEEERLARQKRNEELDKQSQQIEKIVEEFQSMGIEAEDDYDKITLTVKDATTVLAAMRVMRKTITGA